MSSDERVLQLNRCHQQKVCPKMHNSVQLNRYLPAAHYALGNILLS